MPDLNLSDTLRYMCIGYILFGFISISDKENALQLLTDFGVIVISVFALVVGSIFYFIYKPIIYDIIVLHLLDYWRNNWKQNNNCRTFLKETHNIDMRQAENVWSLLYNEYKGEKKLLEKESSGIHLMYMASLTSVIFSIIEILYLHHCFTGLFFLSLAFILMISAFIHESHIEDYEYIVMLSIGNDKIVALVKKIKEQNINQTLCQKNLLDY